MFNESVFGKAKSVRQVWGIFRRVVAMMDELVVVIDRIDRCEGREMVEGEDGDGNTSEHRGEAADGDLQVVLKLVADLMMESEGRVRVIITSAVCQPQSLFDEVNCVLLSLIPRRG